MNGNFEKLQHRTHESLVYAAGLSRSARIFMVDISIIAGKEKSTGQPLKTLYIGETEKTSRTFGKAFTQRESFEKWSNFLFITNAIYSEFRIVRRARNINALWLRHWVKRCQNEVDLIFIDTEILYSFAMDRSQYMQMPQWVNQKLPLGTTWPDILARFRTDAHKELKRVQKQGYSYFTSRSEKYFHIFYDMYLPYTKQRFGEAAAIFTKRQIMKSLRDGEILFVLKSNQVILASLGRYHGDRIAMICWGMAERQSPAALKGGFAALTYFGILNAFERGCTVIDFLNSRPLLENGAFRFKRKWGACVSPIDQPKPDFYLKPCNFRQVTQSFFMHNPLIVLKNNKLIAKALFTKTVSQADLKKCLKHCYSEGIEYIAAFCTAGIDPDALQYHQLNKQKIKLFDISKSIRPELDFCCS